MPFSLLCILRQREEGNTQKYSAQYAVGSNKWAVGEAAQLFMRQDVVSSFPKPDPLQISHDVKLARGCVTGQRTYLDIFRLEYTTTRNRCHTLLISD